MTRKNILLLLVTLISIQIASAQKLPSTLLWRISGNDLQKPSYLYGTMHLTDERIFNLGDSVYFAIENSEGFTTEIDPSEFTSLVINEAKKYAKNKVLLRDFLSTEEYKKYGKLLAEKLNKDVDDISINDIRNEKNKSITESLRNGKMKTFLDMYLFDIARRKGKWTGGLEDPQDQADLGDPINLQDIERVALFENYEGIPGIEESQVDFFINAYIDNNLNLIDSIVSLSDSIYKDAILIRRNIKMAHRIDSITHIRSTVFAIGAAHLSGSKGLITLLRKKGYSVTPVFSSKKIKPSDYKVEELAVKWYDVRDDAGFFDVSMPGNPGNMDWYGLMKMKVYFDAFSSTLYMASAMQTPFNQKMADSLFNDVAVNFFGDSESIDTSPITIGDVPGTELRSSRKEYSHGYLLFKDGKMYMVLAKSMKKDSSEVKDDINRFLHSFTINKPDSNVINTIVYKNELKAFQLLLPAAAQSGAEQVAASQDNSINSELFFSIDPPSGAYLFFGTNESAPGHFIENDSTTLDRIRLAQISKFANVIIDTTYIKDGHRRMEITGTNGNSSTLLKAVYQFRGNRWYALVAMYDSAKDHSAVSSFFNSFVMIDYLPVKWNTYAPKDSLFHTWGPSEFQIISQESNDDDKIVYAAYQASKGDSYSLVQEKFSKYFWQNSDSAFWKLIIDQYEKEDSILPAKQITNGNSKGYEFYLQEKGSANIKRIRILLDADKLFTMVVVKPAAEINNENTDRFFNDFRLDKRSPNPSLFVSKAQLILKDISSEDSTTANEAIEYLSAVPFTKEDLPSLHLAVLKKYPQDRNIDNEEIKQQIGRIITELKDSSSFTFAKRNFENADDTTRNVLLNIMASFPTLENFTDLKNILLKHTPHIEPYNYFESSFTDSLQLAAEILPDILPLLKDSIMAPTIVTITHEISNKGFLDKELLKLYEKDLLTLSKQYYSAVIKNPDSYRFVYFDLLDLLFSLNTTASNMMLQQWSDCKILYLRQNAVNLLLQNNQPIKKTALQALAEDNYTRIALYDTLQAYKRLKLFPSKYATQKLFAESIAFGADDDYDADEIFFVTEKIIEFEGKKSIIYFFKLGYGEGDDQKYFLSCAGPFSLKKKDIATKEAAGFIYDENYFDESKLKDQMDALIQQMKDYAAYRRENAKTD